MPRRGIQAAAYVEFLIVIGPLMLLWLGLAQIGLMYGANLLVAHATARAVRAAVVILPDEEDRYQGDEPLSLSSSGEGLEAYETARDGGRLDAVRRAAQMTLTPISPGLSGAGSGVIQNILLGDQWTDLGVAVTFPDGDGGYHTEFKKTGPLTARVTYLYRCPVPLVDRIICHPFEDGDNGNGGIGQTAKAELDAFGASQLLNRRGTGRRYLAISSERTLPMQGQDK